jgi:ATP-dependent RNA helicase MSS116, mitochondrial
MCSPDSSAIIYQCRHISDQKPFKSGYDYGQRRHLLNELGVAPDKDEALPGEFQSILKKRAPRYAPEFESNPHSRQIRQGAQKEDTDMKPFERFKQKLSTPTYEAITIKPFRHKHATPVQASVLDLLPDLAKPYAEGEDMTDRKDILALSSRGTGKSLAFLVPAIEARQRALTVYAKNEVMKEGVVSNASLETQAKRIYAKTRVGALVLTPTREDATTIANEAILLSRNQPSAEVRLLVGGLSKKAQLRDWMKDRRDIVVATPGRLRDLLTAEAIVREGFQYTSLVGLFLYFITSADLISH